MVDALGGSEHLADVAHLLRRTGFGPFPGAVEATAKIYPTFEDAVEGVLAGPPLELVTPARIDEPLDNDDKELANEALIDHWLRRMVDDGAALHEKMTWFWHTHFTSNVSKCPGHYLWRQLRTLHQLALGNFGDLTKAMCVDGAMMQWLDAAGSSVSDPNENLARELLELFTMGRGNYTEDDVRAAAKALAGWSVFPDEPYPTLSNQLEEPVTFLGQTAVFTPDLIVDRVLEHDATAPFIVAKLARFLIGDRVGDDRLGEWSDLFRLTGYEVRPVVEAMLRSEEFRVAHHARSRSGIEWLCAASRVMGLEPGDFRGTEAFSQIPFTPPNVAGWPDRWIFASTQYARASYLHQLELPEQPIGRPADPVKAALRLCGLFEVSEQTVAALRSEYAATDGDDAALLRSALMTPEFALA